MAGLLLTTDATVHEVPKASAAAAPAGGPGGADLGF
ncbi:hypothetical protein PUN4_180001 [Paraburkholderia unamae]|nr:hypothetical protein PUN4_180001 [Paraburkholderia unamae]